MTMKICLKFKTFTFTLFLCLKNCDIIEELFPCKCKDAITILRSFVLKHQVLSRDLQIL